MYQEMMQAIHNTLVKKGPTQGLTFTAELLPWRQSDGKVYVFQISCFFLRLDTKPIANHSPFPNVP